MKRGLFNQKQLEVLSLRARGFTQLETAMELGTSRNHVSMIEYRARRKLEKARQTVRVFENLWSSHVVCVEKGTRLAEIPLIVLHEGDKRCIHVRSNTVEIVRLVKSLKPTAVKEGKTIRELEFKISGHGILKLSN